MSVHQLYCNYAKLWQIIVATSVRAAMSFAECMVSAKICEESLENIENPLAILNYPLRNLFWAIRRMRQPSSVSTSVPQGHRAQRQKNMSNVF